MLKAEYEKNIVTWFQTKKQFDKHKYKHAKKTDDVRVIFPSDDGAFDGLGVGNDPVVKVFCASLTELLGELSVPKIPLKMLVMVSANNNFPEASLSSGVISHECDLFRMSNLYAAINETQYPINYKEFIFCEEITVFKGVARPMIMSVILVSPLKCPSLITMKTDAAVSEEYNNPTDEKMTFTKIDNAFRLAKDGDYDCLVLPDFGVRNERHPAKKVVEMFNQCILKYKIRYVLFYLKPLDETINRETDPIFRTYHDDIVRFE